MSGVKLFEILFEEVSSPPKPSKRDLIDALEMAKESYYEDGLEDKTLKDFELEYLGLLSVDELSNYGDLSSWMEDIEDEDDMRRFRGDEWFERIDGFYNKNGYVPPIVIVEGDNFVDIGDGRGRVTYANWKGIPLHVYKLKVKQ